MPDSQVIVQYGAKFCKDLFSIDACSIFFVVCVEEPAFVSEKLFTPLKCCMTVAIVPILESVLGELQLLTMLLLSTVIPPENQKKNYTARLKFDEQITIFCHVLLHLLF